MSQPEFSQIVASAARDSKVYSNLSSSTTIAAGGSETIDIFAPSGTICQLDMLVFLAYPPTGSTTGTHQALLYSTNSAGSYLRGISVFGSNVNWDLQDWLTADSSKNPASNGAAYMQNIKFDSVVGLRMTYTNNTNVAQTIARTYAINYTKRTVG